MKIAVRYMAQVKIAAGVVVEEIDLPGPCSTLELLHLLADRHGEALRHILLDEHGRRQPTILMFVNDTQVRDDNTTLQEGDEITFLSPIAGG